MVEDEKKCFFCGSECEICPAPLTHDVKDYRCKYCGQYLLHDFFIVAYQPCNIDKFKIACMLNERRLKGFGGIEIGRASCRERV